MKRKVDVVVVFILIISIFSMILLKEGWGVNPFGNVAKDVMIEPEEPPMLLLYPNKFFDVRFCVTNGDGTFELGLIPWDSTDEVVERYYLENYVDDQGTTVKYACNKGNVYRILN